MGPKRCTTPEGAIVKCGMYSISHFPESRSEASRPFVRKQACNGHHFWGRRENERLAEDGAWGLPLRRVFIIPPWGLLWGVTLDTHFTLSSSGQPAHRLGPHWAMLVWLGPSAHHCSPSALGEVHEARAASFSDKRSVHFLGSQEA